MRTLALTLLLASASVLAFEPGTLVGTVLDAQTKQPVGDVSVTATGPAIGEDERVALTNANGEWSIHVPPGAYLLRFEHPAYRPLERGGVQQFEGRSTRVRIELLPVTVEEIVTIRHCHLGPVDTTSSTIIENISEQFIRNFPLR